MASDNEKTLDRIIAERRQKGRLLAESGRNPYGNGFRPTATCAELRERYQDTKPADETPPEGIEPIDDQTYRVAGRAVAKRGFGKTVFLPIRDGSGDLQLYLNVEHIDEAEFKSVVKKIDAGDIVGAEGKMFWTKRGELSLLADSVTLVTKSLRPPPEKWSGLKDVEIRYRQRYTDLAFNPDIRDVFRKRSQLIRGMRAFLDERDFLEVETPMLNSLIGGAAARPFTTHHNALDIPLFMRIAPELYLKRLVVGGFERVYEIGRNFRNEGLSRKHNPEFTMLEFYQAYADYRDLMDLTEEMVSSLAQQINGSTKASWDGTEVDLAPGWRRLSVRDAVVDLGGQSGAVFEDPTEAARVACDVGANPRAVAAALLESLSANAVKKLAKKFEAGNADGLVGKFAESRDERPAIAKAIAERYGSPLEARVRAGQIGYMIFEETAEDKLVQPTFLTHFPLAVSPLARRNEDDPSVCDRFELLVCGNEMANAFSELNDPDDQRERFKAQVSAKAVGADETMDYDEDYCRALEVGMPPAAGEGIGVDRLTMLLTGQSSIRDVILFPLMRPE